MTRPEPPHHRRDPRNLLIGALSLMVLLLGGLVVSQSVKSRIERPETPSEAPPRGEAVGLIIANPDRTNRRWVDFAFDRPLGQDRVGEILPQPPAATTPETRGVWHWLTANVLRFEPAAPLDPARTYDIEFIADRLLRPGQVFRDEARVSFQIAPFTIVGLEVEEVPVEGANRVKFRGRIDFNYPVDPRAFVTHARMIDPKLGEAYPLPLSTRYRSSRKRIRFESPPLQKAAEPRVLRLEIDQDLPARIGDARGDAATLPAPFVRQIPLGSSLHLTVRDVTARAGLESSTITIELSSPVEAAQARAFLTLRPEVKVQLDSTSTRLTLRGPFRAGQSVELTLRKGLRARDGAQLRETFHQRLDLPDLEPRVEFQARGLLLPAAGHGALTVETINVDALDVMVDKVFPNNLVYLLTNYGWQVRSEEAYRYNRVSRVLGRRLDDKALAIADRPNERVVTPLDVRGWVDEPGLYRIALIDETMSRGAQRWLLMSNLGLVAKRGPAGEVWVWVYHVETLEPLSGVTLRVMSDRNQLLARGETDGRGFWTTTIGTEEQERRGETFLLTAERDGDWSFLDFRRSRVDTTGLDLGGAKVSATGYEAFVYGERDIYRPGEEVHAVALVRGPGRSVPPPMPARIRHLDGEGQVVSVERGQVSAAGEIPLRIELDEAAPTGRHTLEVLIGSTVAGSYSFHVESFVPDRIRVDIDAPEAAPGPGEEMGFTVAAAYLFGLPAGGLALETHAYVEARDFAPPGAEGFTFGDPQRALPQREVFQARERLDEQGRRTMAFRLPADLRPPTAAALTLVARVQEEGGRGVTATLRRLVHPVPFYVGLRQAAGADEAEPGRPRKIEVVGRRPDGTATPMPQLEVSFLEVRWQTLLQQTASGTYRYVSLREEVPLDSFQLEGGAPEAAIEVTPPSWGLYEVLVADPESGAATRLPFFVTGWGTAPWALTNPDRLELHLLGEEQRPGGRARLEVRAPFPGRLLVTVERERLSWWQTYRLAGNTAVVDVPLREAFQPNAYVTATLLRSGADVEPGTPGRAFGAIPLPVDRNRHRLDLEIRSPEEVRPETRLAIEVTARPGSRVSLAAVDEGILQLIHQRLPDPFAFFYRKRALEVSSHDLFGLLYPDVAPERAAPGGGFGALDRAQVVGTTPLTRAEPVAFWFPPTPVPASGAVRFDLDLPAFQGSLRLMAVAHDGADFGAAARPLTVRSPLILMPSAPRVLAFDDEAEAPVTVINNGAGAVSVELDVALEGPGELIDPPRVTLDLPAGGEATRWFGLRAGHKAGEIALRFGARAGDETTAAGAAILVRSALPYQRRIVSGTIEGDSATLPTGGDEFEPGSTSVDVWVGAHPLIRIAGHLARLLAYPYGCVEQTTSKAFPLLYLGELARATQAADVDERGPLPFVQAALRRLGSMQHASGGFSFWPRGTEVVAFPSLYATHFMVEAQQAGFVVESYRLDRALRFVSEEVTRRWVAVEENAFGLAYGLYILALADRPLQGLMDRMREEHLEGLDGPSRALLAAAYARVGRSDAARALMSGVEAPPEGFEPTGPWMRSILRDRAIVLLAWVEVDPASREAKQVADRILEDLGEPPTTQEAAWALLALGRYVSDKTFRGSYGVRLFEGDRLLDETQQRPLTSRGLEPRDRLRVEVERQTPGALYYATLLRGVPRSDRYRPRSEGLTIERTWLNRAGHPLTPSTWKQGELVVLKIRVGTTRALAENVLVETPLPGGLEVENPRLHSSEQLPWVTAAKSAPAFADVRYDRVIHVFSRLTKKQKPAVVHVLFRVTTPGRFALPPGQAEAMYDPTLAASTPLGRFEVVR